MMSRTLLLVASSLFAFGCSPIDQSFDSVPVGGESAAIELRPERVASSIDVQASPLEPTSAPAPKSSSTSKPDSARAVANPVSVLLSNQAFQPVAADAKPELIALSPDSGPAGDAYPVAITITGRGFMPTGNTVTFGPTTIADLPSENGTRITFHAPKNIPSRGEVPPMVLPAGEYWLTVTTPAGVSNRLRFSLTRNP